VPWAAYMKHLGIVDNLAADCPVKRTSPNARPGNGSTRDRVGSVVGSHVE